MTSIYCSNWWFIRFAPNICGISTGNAYILRWSTQTCPHIELIVPEISRYVRFSKRISPSARSPAVKEEDMNPPQFLKIALEVWQALICRGHTLLPCKMVSILPFRVTIPSPVCRQTHAHGSYPHCIPSAACRLLNMPLGVRLGLWRLLKPPWH